MFGRARHLELGVPLTQRALQLRHLGQPRGFRVGRRRHVGDELRLLDTQRLVLPGQLLGVPCAWMGDGGGEKEVSRPRHSPSGLARKKQWGVLTFPYDVEVAKAPRAMASSRWLDPICAASSLVSCARSAFSPSNCFTRAFFFFTSSSRRLRSSSHARAAASSLSFV